MPTYFVADPYLGKVSVCESEKLTGAQLVSRLLAGNQDEPGPPFALSNLYETDTQEDVVIYYTDPFADLPVRDQAAVCFQNQHQDDVVRDGRCVVAVENCDGYVMTFSRDQQLPHLLQEVLNTIQMKDKDGRRIKDINPVEWQQDKTLETTGQEPGAQR
ncbi:hypothetical protein ACQU0X_26595 [Pseudovibrio ascidiaceicola]|uniref:hypothetical protein n=1 Tax=Pseudovibrio ascidiaceicola TaxID=285279 RepID=UPI003D3686FE